MGGAEGGRRVAVTIHDVAHRAGVSVSTVSRALALPDLVRASTRQRVLAAAAELGYQPNRAARGLVTGRTGTLGVVVPDVENPFFGSVLKGVHGRAREGGQVVFLADTAEDARVEAEVVAAMVRQVDGVVLCSPRLPDEDLHRAAGGVPVVLVNRAAPGLPGVLMDAADGVRQAVEHLAALGHRRVAHLTGPRASWSAGERLRGLRAAAPVLGVQAVELGPFPPTFEGGLAAADLALASGATGVLAYNDLVALGVLSRLAARGVAVPAEVSVVGFDDTRASATSTPALSTVRMPTREAGRAAVELLLDLLDRPGASPAAVRAPLPTQLVVRATTAPPPGAASGAAPGADVLEPTG